MKLTAIASAALALCLCACDREVDAPARPNVLIYLPDTLRADHLGAYGYWRDTSPRITEFSEGAVLFENAHSQSSWTKAAVGTLFSGLFPSRHGAIRREHRLREDVPALAQLLRDAGYRTAAILRNPIVLPEFGFGRGFERIVDRIRFDLNGEGASYTISLALNAVNAERFDIATGANEAPSSSTLPWTSRGREPDLRATDRTSVAAASAAAPFARIYEITTPASEVVEIDEKLDAQLKALGYMGDEEFPCGIPTDSDGAAPS
jgi:arylsulfatase A-like enzyme